MLGYIVGNEMDKYDRQRLNQVYETEPSGQSVAWVNPDTGNRYTVTPEPAFTNPSTSQVCRDAEIHAVIDGRDQEVQPPHAEMRTVNGTWIIAEEGVSLPSSLPGRSGAFVQEWRPIRRARI